MSSGICSYRGTMVSTTDVGIQDLCSGSSMETASFFVGTEPLTSHCFTKIISSYLIATRPVTTLSHTASNSTVKSGAETCIQHVQSTTLPITDLGTCAGWYRHCSTSAWVASHLPQRGHYGFWYHHALLGQNFSLFHCKIRVYHQRTEDIGWSFSRHGLLGILAWWICFVSSSWAEIHTPTYVMQTPCSSPCSQRCRIVPFLYSAQAILL